VEDRLQKEAVKKQSEKESQNDYSNRMTFKEKFEFEQLEKRIKSLESEKAKLEKTLTEATNHEDLTRISSALGEVSQSLDECEMRWLELSEKESR
jgi:ATP-binding cassette subfamily F protein uup